MPPKPRVRWNDKKKLWTSSVTFPDGRTEFIRRVDKNDAEQRLEDALERRAKTGISVFKQPQKQPTYQELYDVWWAADCPLGGIPSAHGVVRRRDTIKGTNTLTQIEACFENHVLPQLGKLRNDATQPDTITKHFYEMDKKRRSNAREDAPYEETRISSDYVKRTWWHLANCVEWNRRQRRTIQTNPVLEARLPPIRANQKERKSLQLEDLDIFLAAVLNDLRAAMWLTGIMPGLRPGEVTGLRWPFVHLAISVPILEIEERAHYENSRYVGQAPPKVGSKRSIELHPMNTAALIHQRTTLQALGLYDPEGFVFPVTTERAGNATRSASRIGQPMLLSSVRKHLRAMLAKTPLGTDWTTYELRHSFVSLADDELQNLQLIADVVGHNDIKTTGGYRKRVQAATPHSRVAWEGLLARQNKLAGGGTTHP